MTFPYQGPVSFLGAETVLWRGGKPVLAAGTLAGFLGLPYDAATTYRAGARFGPQAIRRASMMLTDGAHPLFETDPRPRLLDWGDAMIASTRQEAMLAQVADTVAVCRAHTRRLLCAGGDHLVSLGVLRGLRDSGCAPLSLVHFDAHCDTWERHGEDRYGHGTWVRNAVEEALIAPARTISLGMRSPVDPTTRRWLVDQGGTTLDIAAVCRLDAQELVERIVAVIGTGPAYLSFDIDVLDPAFAPGTGTPEIGGLTSAAARDILERLLTHHDVEVTAMDVVEVAPAYDHHDVTALAAATLLWTYACACVCAAPASQPIA